MYFQKSANKYHAKSSIYNGIYYHSQLEAGYAQELDLRVKAKDIKSWERQVKLDLRVNDHHIANYYLDFIVTHNDGRREFVEVKGMETEAWRMKWAILEATFDRFKTGPDDSLTVIKQTNWGKPSFMRRLSPRR
jgi:hypothetical protein